MTKDFAFLCFIFCFFYERHISVVEKKQRELSLALHVFLVVLIVKQNVCFWSISPEEKLFVFQVAS